MDRWSVEFFLTESGRSPVQEYIDGLRPDEGAAIADDLLLMAEFGTALGMPHVRPLKGKIWELRVRTRVQHRVLYAAIVDRTMVLLHAFTKKTQQTPPAEIATAEKRLSDFQRRRAL